jgi:hypothetical protein
MKAQSINYLKAFGFETPFLETHFLKALLLETLFLETPFLK